MAEEKKMESVHLSALSHRLRLTQWRTMSPDNNTAQLQREQITLHKIPKVEKCCLNISTPKFP